MQTNVDDALKHLVRFGILWSNPVENESNHLAPGLDDELKKRGWIAPWNSKITDDIRRYAPTQAAIDEAKKRGYELHPSLNQ